MILVLILSLNFHAIKALERLDRVRSDTETQKAYDADLNGTLERIDCEALPS